MIGSHAPLPEDITFSNPETMLHVAGPDLRAEKQAVEAKAELRLKGISSINEAPSAEVLNKEILSLPPIESDPDIA